MTWGIATATLLQIHVTISLIAIASGPAVLRGLRSGNWFHPQARTSS